MTQADRVLSTPPTNRVRAISTSLRPNCLAVACSSIAGGNDSCANMLTQPMEISRAAGQTIVSPLTGEANRTTR